MLQCEYVRALHATQCMAVCCVLCAFRFLHHPDITNAMLCAMKEEKSENGVRPARGAAAGETYAMLSGAYSTMMLTMTQAHLTSVLWGAVGVASRTKEDIWCSQQSVQCLTAVDHSWDIPRTNLSGRNLYTSACFGSAHLPLRAHARVHW